MARILIIEESLNEFAKRGRPRKNAKKPSDKMRGIDAPDSWNDTEEEDSEEVIDDVDVSDMTNAETIEIENDAFSSELLKALSNELKFPDFNRRTVRFHIKGDLDKKSTR